ncbi:uncharacterized protein ACMZJ9_021302 [Mantella aurantiaca]
MRTLLVLGILAVLLLVTPSNSAGTQDGGGEKSVDSGFRDVTISELARNRPVRSSQPCCRRGGQKSCKICPESFKFSPMPKMKSMDSGHRDLTIRRLTKREEPSSVSVRKSMRRPCGKVSGACGGFYKLIEKH